MKTIQTQIENMNEQYIEDHLSELEEHFVANTDEGRMSLDDDIEDNFNNWLEETSFIEKRNILNK